MTMFGVEICTGAEDVRDEETINGIVFDANCKGVISLAKEEEVAE